MDTYRVRKWFQVPENMTVAIMPTWMLPRISEEASLWVAAGFSKLATLFAAWSQNSFGVIA